MNANHLLRIGLLAGLAGLVSVARADERVPHVPPLPAYRQECAACHIAYPPSLLPAASWQRLLADLPHHFGSDASLDPATVQQLSGWLTAHAGGGTSPPQDRITRSPWFVHEHGKLPDAVWRRAAVRSASNCAACHAGAAEGDFSESRVRIPR